jgi:hypothetical protein
MTDRQDLRTDGSELADAMQAAHETKAEPTRQPDRRDSRPRSVGYGWSAAGTTLVI